ncbi:bifunctional folylpolyglutamate synthase/dihydrofolate synthase [Alkalicoccus luteus]|uniref:bifunctional folylpolyglutamate synthase/dihydrofolate synthase n=1 Tax=Alkalicoccus luteus TaxID=1237094 RepID=UPI004033604B
MDIHKLFHDRKQAGINYTLERMRALYQKLDRPEQDAEVIHIAGTNGKGSTVSYLEALFAGSSKTVLSFVSPSFGGREGHLLWNGEPVTADAFAEVCRDAAAFLPGVERVHGMVSPFELLTATAFAACKRWKPDVFLVECGLGGRLDATNVLENKAVTILTSIGTDHEAFLGHGREQIAREKAGIMRQGVPVVSGCGDADTWLKEEAEKCGADWMELERTWSFLPPETLETPKGSVTLPAPGAHQEQNAACAWTAARLFGVPLQEAWLSQARMPGRFEQIQPGVYVDSAHNIEAVEAMLNSVPNEWDVTFLFGAMRDKAVHEMVSRLTARGRVVPALFPDSRAMTEHEWLELLPSESVCSDPKQFVHDCSGSAEGKLIVTGSHAFTSMIRN